MNKFGRLLTAMVTPFDTKGEVDYVQAKKLALALLDSGSDGLVVSGSTGESPTLTNAEKLKLFAEIKATVGSRGAVIAGTGSYCTNESIQLTRQAENAGVDGCLLVVPYYNKPTQDGLLAHFRSIAEATRLPCILYNVPSRTVTNLAPETVFQLASITNIVGLKEASGNFDQASRILRVVPSGFKLYSGNDGDTLPLMSLGAYGAISVASHLVGKQMQKMINDFLKGDTSGAAAAHSQLSALFNGMFVLSNPIPIKYALNKLGYHVGRPRLPLTEPDAQSAAKIDLCLRSCKIDLPVQPG